MKKVFIFTDGACRGNPGPGGWAALLRYGSTEKLISGGEKLTTNNRMEMMAAIKAFSILKTSCNVELFTDSQYLHKGISIWLANWKQNGWKKSDKKPIKNFDLWQALDHETTRHKITWHWIRGHSGHPENELVDKAANIAIEKLSE